MFDELEAVKVVEEADPDFLGGGACLVEDLDHFAGLGLVEGVFVIGPCASRLLEAERLRLRRYAVGIALPSVPCEMAGDRLQPALRQQGKELGGFEIIGARELDRLEAEVLRLVEPGLDPLGGEERAEAVELESRLSGQVIRRGRPS